MLTLSGHTGAVCSLAYAPDSRTLASGGADKSVRLRDVAARRTTVTLKGHRTYAHAVAFSPDGRLLASAGGDLYLRDPATGRAALARQEGGQPAAGVSFSADGRLLVTAGRRLGGANTAIAGDVKFWDAGAAAALIHDNSFPSPRGKPIALMNVDVALGESMLAEYLRNNRWGAWCVTLDPAGRLLAVGTDTGGVVLWDVAASGVRGRLETTAAVRSLAFSGDGSLLAAAEASRVQVWDARTRLGVATLKGHDRQVWSVAFAPGSTASAATLISGGQDGTVRVWDVTAGRERSVFSWPLGAVRAVAAAPDGMTAAAGGEKGEIVVWDCEG